MLRLQTKSLINLTRNSFAGSCISARSFSEKKTEGQRNMMQRLGETIKREAKKTWNGCKILNRDGKYLMRKKYAITFHGEEYSIRDRKLMEQTSTDLLKMIPFSVFIIVPGAELLLPLCLYIFPNMIPSTFLSKTKQDEAWKGMIQQRPLHADKLHRYLLDVGKQLEHTDFKPLLDKFRSNPHSVTRKELIDNIMLFKTHIRFGKMDADYLLSTCRFLGVEPWTGFKTFNKIFMVPISKLLGLFRLNFPREYKPKMFPFNLVYRNMIMLQLRQECRYTRLEDTLLLAEDLDKLDLEIVKLCCRERAIDTEFSGENQMRNELKEWVKHSTFPTPKGRVPNELLVLSQIFQYIQDIVIPEEEHVEEKHVELKDLVEESMERVLTFDSSELIQLLEKLEKSDLKEVTQEDKAKYLEKLGDVLDAKLSFEEHQRIEAQIKRLEEYHPDEIAEPVEGPTKP